MGNGKTFNVTDTDMYLQGYTFRNWLCNAGKDYFYVHVTGDVYSCTNQFYDNRMPIDSIYSPTISSIKLKP